MKNTTNWYLYTTSNSEKKTTQSVKTEKLTKEIQNKIQLIKKAFK